MFSTVGIFRGFLFLLFLGVSQVRAGTPEDLARSITFILINNTTPTTQKLSRHLNTTNSTDTFLAALSKEVPKNCTAALERFSKGTSNSEIAGKGTLFTEDFDSSSLLTPTDILKFFSESPQEQWPSQLKKLVEEEESLFFSLVYKLVTFNPDTYHILKIKLSVAETGPKKSIGRTIFKPLTLMAAGSALTFLGFGLYDRYVPVSAPETATVDTDKKLDSSPVKSVPEVKKDPIPTRLQIKDLKPGTYRLLTEGSEIGLWLHNSRITRADYFYGNQAGLKVTIESQEKDTIEYLFLSETDTDSYQPNDKRLPEKERGKSVVGFMKITSPETFELHPKQGNTEAPVLKFQISKE